MEHLETNMVEQTIDIAKFVSFSDQSAILLTTSHPYKPHHQQSHHFGFLENVYVKMSINIGGDFKKYIP